MQEQVKKLVSQNKLMAALEMLETNFSSGLKEESIILLKNKLKRLEQEINEGILEKEKAEIEYNKITKAILQLNSGEVIDFLETQTQRLSLIKWGLGLIGFVVILFFLFKIITSFDGGNSTQGSESPIIDAGRDVNYENNSSLESIEVPENLQKYIKDSLETDSTP